MTRKTYSHSYNTNVAQAGGALVYILVAIAVIGALTATLIEPSGQQARSQKGFQLAQQIDAQIQFIKSAIQECVINYPAGDPTITEPGYHAPYPLEPTSSHFTGSTLGPAPHFLVEYVRCPGNPGVDNNHTPIFGPTTGRNYPKPLIANHRWHWFNGTGTSNGRVYDGIFMNLSPFQTRDAYVTDAFERLDAKYSDCELEYIPNGDGTNGCLNGRNCLIYWFKRVTPAC